MIQQNRLKEVLHYDANTGIFTWKVNKSQMKAGTIAGSTGGGYILIGIDGIRYLAHRLAWLYVYGYFPENVIDHINRNRSDNRIKNLREVSHQCNIRNSGNLINNKSGVKGVHWCKTHNKWVSKIKVNGKCILLGYYSDFVDAVYARYNKEVELGWSGCDSTSPAYLFLKKKRRL